MVVSATASFGGVAAPRVGKSSHVGLRFGGFVVGLGSAGLVPLAIAPFALMVAFTGLELLIAGLQAYVFTILTCIYLNEAIHMDH